MVNLTAISDFVGEILTLQDGIVNLIVFGVIVYIVKRFGKSIAGMFEGIFK